MFQMSFGAVFHAIKSCRTPDWLTRLLMASFIFGGFSAVFLAFRLVINRVPPKLTYAYVR